jgi:dihydropteroate synthase
MVKDTFFNKKRLINLRGNLIDLTIPKLMGILNVTPDSFYDGGYYEMPDKLKKRVNEMLTQGADIIDIGAYSSRPDASHISVEEELRRLSKALDIIGKYYPEAFISVDTFRSEVAETVCRDYAVDLINDISGGMLDKKMPETVAKLQIPYIIMHMPGDPRTMQKHTAYTDVMRDIIEFLGRQVHHLLRLGVNDIIVDPGFGFGKTLDQNFELLCHLDDFKILELPLLVGLSRKSMIYKTLGIKPEDALNGTTALHMIALEHGADILRVHDIKEAKETIQLFKKVNEAR